MASAVPELLFLLDVPHLARRDAAAVIGCGESFLNCSFGFIWGLFGKGELRDHDKIFQFTETKCAVDTFRIIDLLQAKAVDGPKMPSRHLCTVRLA